MRWVKIHDGLLEWGWHTRPEMVSLFVHLILLANTRDRDFEGQTIRRGQLLTSLRALSERTGISLQTIRTSLAHLESTGELTRESTQQGTLITICKYADYQDEETPANTPTNKQLTHDQHTTNTRPTQTLDLNNNNNNNNNINNSCCCSDAPAPAREEGFSFWSLSEEQQQQEQQDYYRIFFFGNFRNVPAEVKRFIATNESHHWLNKGRTECYSTPAQRRAIAELWRPASKNPRIPSNAFLAMWKDLYALALRSDPDVAALMLDERVTVGETSDGRLYMVTHQEVWDWMRDETRAKETRKIVNRFSKKTFNAKIIH